MIQARREDEPAIHAIHVTATSNAAQQTVAVVVDLVGAEHARRYRRYRA
jgi:hypothetical protein